MKECAFCGHVGKLSNEHIVSQWIGKLFPGHLHAWYQNAKGVEKRFSAKTIDWKAGVVCKTCNEGWMSKLESEQAQPILTPLITGKTNIAIGPSEARSIALFAFKTAVIVDHANRIDPFYSIRQRHAFRKHFLIPDNVHMWLCAYAGNRGGGKVCSHYGQGETPYGNRLHTYICTCAFGNFVFQVLTVKQLGRDIIRPRSTIARLGVEFWPAIRPNFIWPPPEALLNAREFVQFSEIWADITVIHPK